MSAFRSLTGLYLKSFYNLPSRGGAGKRDPKALLKIIGIAVLGVVVAVDFGFIFISINLGLYRGFATLGLQGLLILNAAVMVTALTLVIGFMTALSTYHLNDMENRLLAMPLRPRDLLAAKFAAVYAAEALASLFFMACAMVILGIYERPHPLFYAWGLVAALLLPLPPLALCYLIQVPLMSAARFLRNRKAVMLVGGLVGLACALGFNLYFQRFMVKLSDPEALAAMVGGADSFMSQAGRVYPPATLAWRAMSAPASLGALASMAGLAVFCLGPAAVVIAALAKPYARSLLGFDETVAKRLSASGTDAFLSRRLRSGRVFPTLVARELRMLNREPMYLLNGPFVVVLLPVIFGIMYLAQGEALLTDPDFAGILAMARGGLGVALAALAGAFMGSSTSIACTALSRDAKALAFMKSLPIDPGLYLLAKFAHAELFALLGAGVGAGLVAWILRLGFAGGLVAAAAATAMASLINLVGLWLDTANPRLSWDNPIAAMKQNPNSIIVILGAMGLLAAAGYGAFSLGLDARGVALWYGVAPAIAIAVLLPLYLRYARRRVAALEG